MDSSYYLLTHYRLKPSQRERRIKALELALEQLEQYHDKAPLRKKPIIERLIDAYDTLLNNLTI